MEKKIDITFWSDFACPYCYIGITRLKRVIREMGADAALIGETLMRAEDKRKMLQTLKEA